jgi:hypothetical protein
MLARFDLGYNPLGSGPTPSFFNGAPWRIRVEPRRGDWDAPPSRDRLG